MISYTTINSVLPLISKSVRREDTVPNLKSYILQGYDLMPSISRNKEGILILQVKDHKAQLPKDVKNINLVTHMYNDPTADESANLTGIETRTITIDLSTSDETNLCVGNYILSHKLFINSDYYNNNFNPMKYIGTSKFVCTDCVNRFCHNCNNTWSIDENKVLHTSVKDGYVCIIYETRVRVDNDFAIIDDPDVKYFLARYAELEHFRERSYSQENNAIYILDRLEAKVNTWYNKARSAILKTFLNKQLISEMLNNRYNARLYQNAPYIYRNNDD